MTEQALVPHLVRKDPQAEHPEETRTLITWPVV